MFPEESMQVSAFVLNKDTVARFTQRKTSFAIVSTKAMWLSKITFIIFSNVKKLDMKTIRN